MHTLRRGVFLFRWMRFPSEAASKLNAIRCITPFLRLGVIDSKMLVNKAINR